MGYVPGRGQLPRRNRQGSPSLLKTLGQVFTDLNCHRGNERANVGYAEGLRAMGNDGVVLAEQIELAHCDRCGADTARPKGPVMMIGGKRTADACYECSG